MADAATSPPPFDPNQPFTTEQATAPTPPPFDPSKPFVHEGAPAPASDSGDIIQDMRDYANSATPSTGPTEDAIRDLASKIPDGYITGEVARRGLNLVADANALPTRAAKAASGVLADIATGVGNVGTAMGDAVSGDPTKANQYIQQTELTGSLPSDLMTAAGLSATPFNPEAAAAATTEKAVVPRYPEAQARLKDFEQSGITPTLPAVTQDRTLGNVANVTKEVPFLGAPIETAAKQQVAQAAQRGADIADTFGDAASPKAGGEALKAGYDQFKYGPTGAPNAPAIEKAEDIFKPTRAVGFLPKSQALYDSIPIDPAISANVDNTAAALGRLKNQFPSNPELNQLLATPTFGKLYSAIAPGMKEVASDRQMIMPTGRGWATGQAPERISAAPARMAETPSSPTISLGGDTGFQFTPPGRAAVQEVAPGYNLSPAGADAIAPTPSGFAMTDATELQPTGGMSWGDLKSFRSYAGRQMRQPSDQLGLGPDGWKALYGAASQDMQATATDQGPAAVKAFNRANSYYSAGLQRLNDAMGFIDKATSDEGAYNALLAKGSDRGKSADIARFQATMKSLPPEFKGDVASAMINRMGQPIASQASADTPFSIGTWATNYNSLSPAAKDAVFGTAGTQQRDDLEALSRSVSALKGVDRLGNPSGSGRYATVGAAASAATYGAIFHPVETALAAGTTAGAAKLLTSPGMARWIANSTKVVTPEGWSSQMARLGKMAAQNPGVVGPFYSEVTKASQPQQTPGMAQGGRVPHPNPSAAQKSAGNYRMGHVSFQGIPITIENAKGSTRSGVGQNGKPWRVAMPAHYGYFKRTEGADGDHVDVYLGADAKSDRAFIIDQIDADKGSWDEHKAMLGYSNMAAALSDYRRSFSDGKGEKRIGNVRAMSIADLKAWLSRGDTKAPIASA